MVRESLVSIPSGGTLPRVLKMTASRFNTIDDQLMRLTRNRTDVPLTLLSSEFLMEMVFHQRLPNSSFQAGLVASRPQTASATQQSRALHPTKTGWRPGEKASQSACYPPGRW